MAGGSRQVRRVWTTRCWLKDLEQFTGSFACRALLDFTQSQTRSLVLKTSACRVRRTTSAVPALGLLAVPWKCLLKEKVSQTGRIRTVGSSPRSSKVSDAESVVCWQARLTSVIVDCVSGSRSFRKIRKTIWAFRRPVQLERLQLATSCTQASTISTACLVLQDTLAKLAMPTIQRGLEKSTGDWPLPLYSRVTSAISSGDSVLLNLRFVSVLILVV